MNYGDDSRRDRARCVAAASRCTAAPPAARLYTDALAQEQAVRAALADPGDAADLKAVRTVVAATKRSCGGIRRAATATTRCGRRARCRSTRSNVSARQRDATPASAAAAAGGGVSVEQVRPTGAGAAGGDELGPSAATSPRGSCRRSPPRPRADVPVERRLWQGPSFRPASGTPPRPPRSRESAGSCCPTSCA